MLDKQPEKPTPQKPKNRSPRIRRLNTASNSKTDDAPNERTAGKTRNVANVQKAKSHHPERNKAKAKAAYEGGPHIDRSLLATYRIDMAINSLIEIQIL